MQVKESPISLITFTAESINESVNAPGRDKIYESNVLNNALEKNKNDNDDIEQLDNNINPGDLANSVLYLGAGLELILVFLVLSLASRRGVRDRNIVIIGLVIMVMALLWLLVLLPSLPYHNRWIYNSYIFIIIL